VRVTAPVAGPNWGGVALPRVGQEVLVEFLQGDIDRPVVVGGLLAGWWPLNILFTLLAMTATLFLIERGGQINAIAAGAVLVLGGSSVEFWWPAILLGMAVWFYAKRPSATALIVAVLACAALAAINRNFWARAALPVIATTTRWKWAFYAYYPAHLTALWLIRIPMSHAGYLFFM